MARSLLFAPVMTSWGLFPRSRANVSLHGTVTSVAALPAPSDMGGHVACVGGPNTPPLPAELCVSLNNYSDESITIRPNSHSAELTQIILILCFYQ